MRFKFFPGTPFDPPLAAMKQIGFNLIFTNLFTNLFSYRKRRRYDSAKFRKDDRLHTGYNYDATTGTITIDTTMIYTTLQTAGNGIQLSGSDTFDTRGIIVLRTSNTGVKALSRRCTHQNNTVNINTAGNNLLCPSHNSIFDLNGNVVSGPATGALTSYTCSLNAEGTIITITSA